MQRCGGGSGDVLHCAGDGQLGESLLSELLPRPLPGCVEPSRLLAVRGDVTTIHGAEELCEWSGCFEALEQDGEVAQCRELLGGAGQPDPVTDGLGEGVERPARIPDTRPQRARRNDGGPFEVTIANRTGDGDGVVVVGESTVRVLRLAELAPGVLDPAPARRRQRVIGEAGNS